METLSEILNVPYEILVGMLDREKGEYMKDAEDGFARLCDYRVTRSPALFVTNAGLRKIMGLKADGNEAPKQLPTPMPSFPVPAEQIRHWESLDGKTIWQKLSSPLNQNVKGFLLMPAMVWNALTDNQNYLEPAKYYAAEVLALQGK